MTAEDLRHAIDLVRQGQKQEGAQALMRYLDDEPQNATAWLWLAAAVPDAEKGRFCLEQVLAIDPENKKAREWLARLESQESPAPAPPAATTPEVEPAAEADVAEAIILEETVAVDAEEGAPDTAVDATAATEEATDEEAALSFDEETFEPGEAGEEGEEEFLAFDDDLFADFEAEEEPPPAEPASFEEELFAVEEGLFELEPGEEAAAEPISDEELFKMDDDLAEEEAFAGDDEFPTEEAFATGAEPEPEAATAPAEEAFLGDEFLADEFAGEEAFAGDDESAGDVVDEDAFAADFLTGEAFAAEETDVIAEDADVAAEDADVVAEEVDDDFALFEELAAASTLPGADTGDEPAAEDELLSFEQDVFGPAAEEAAPVEEDTFSFDDLLEEAQDEDLEPGDEEFLFAGEFEATDDAGATVAAEPDAEQEPVFTLDEDLASLIPAADQPAATAAGPVSAAARDEPALPQEVPAGRPRRRTGQVVIAIIALILLVGICGLIVLFALQFSGI